MSDDIGGIEEVVASPEAIEIQSNDLANDLAADLYPEKQASSKPADDPLDDETTPIDEVKTPADEVIVRQPPKSWTKEMQTKYSALPPEVQDYVELREKQMSEGLEKDRGDANLGRVMRDTMTPYRAMLQSQGVDEVKAVQSLMNVHYRLTNLPMSEKTAYLKSIAAGYGIGFDDPAFREAETANIDPAIKKMMDELSGIKQHLTANQQNAIQQSKERVSRDVEAFASNHPYFDEIADDIAAMIQSGHDLDAAYEKAVWANPVTRQKELARLQTEETAKLREKAKITADASRKAAGLNVRNRDTSRTPTGPKATMRNLDSALEESMREIKSRTH